MAFIQSPSKAVTFFFFVCFSALVSVLRFTPLFLLFPFLSPVSEIENQSLNFVSIWSFLPLFVRVRVWLATEVAICNEWYISPPPPPLSLSLSPSCLIVCRSHKKGQPYVVRFRQSEMHFHGVGWNLPPMPQIFALILNWTPVGDKSWIAWNTWAMHWTLLVTLSHSKLVSFSGLTMYYIVSYVYSMYYTLCSIIQPGAVKLILWRHWIHATAAAAVTSENQFHCTRLYVYKVLCTMYVIYVL